MKSEAVEPVVVRSLTLYIAMLSPSSPSLFVFFTFAYYSSRGKPHIIIIIKKTTKNMIALLQGSLP